MPQPNPQEHARITDPEDAPAVRRLDCRSYNACLTVCCAKHWEGFTCNGCAAHDPQTRTEARGDLDGLAGVVAQVAPGLRLAMLRRRHRRA